MKPAVPITYSVAAGWALAAFFALQFVIALSVTVRPGAATDIVHLGACEALIFTLLSFMVLSVHDPERSLTQALGLRATHPGLVVLGLALGLTLRLPADSVRMWVEGYFPTPEKDLIMQAELLSQNGLIDVIKLLMVLAIVGPLVEELFYRGALYGALVRAKSMLGAGLLTAVAFVVAHAGFRDYPSLFLVALVLSHLRSASGSLLPCLALHVGFNTAAVLSLATGAASSTSQVSVPWALALAGWVIVAALSLLVHRLSASADATHARTEDLA